MPNFNLLPPYILKRKTYYAEDGIYKSKQVKKRKHENTQTHNRKVKPFKKQNKTINHTIDLALRKTHETLPSN